MAAYYRLFYLQQHYTDWNAQRFNSDNKWACGAWMEIYKSGSRNPADYPLLQPEGKYTESALRNFLEISNRRKPSEKWTDEEVLKAGQLDGVCAFADLESVIRYANGAESEGRAIAVFEGVWISDIIETGGGYSGVLVRPTKAISLKPLKEYRNEENA